MKKFYIQPNTECQIVYNANNICIASVQGPFEYGGGGGTGGGPIDPM